MSLPVTADSPEMFHLFGKLPCELRIKIWEYALPGPRIVHLKELERWTNDEEFRQIYGRRGRSHYGFWDEAEEDGDDGERGNGSVSGEESEGSSQSQGTDSGYDWYFVSSTPIPALLHVCRESAAVASKFYQKAFSTPTSEPQVYFNFDLDILYIDENSFSVREMLLPIDFGALYGGSLINLGRAELEKVRRLAVCWDYGRSFDILHRVLGIMSDSRLFPTLDKLIVVHDCHQLEKGRHQLILMEPFGVSWALRLYRGGVYSFTPEEIEVEKWAITSSMRNSVSLFEEQWDKWGKAHGVVWKIPELQFRTLTTTLTAAKLQEAQDKFCRRYNELPDDKKSKVGAMNRVNASNESQWLDLDDEEYISHYLIGEQQFW